MKSYTKHPVKNIELRMYIASQGIPYKKIAEKMYLSQSGLSQALREELPEWRRQKILAAIIEIRDERGDFNNAKKGFSRDYVDSNMGSAMVNATSEAVR